MSTAPVHEIDPAAFWADPCPELKRMRARAPAVFVPQLGATLLTRRDDIFAEEKRIEVFSSDQPDGLMTVLMGQNMMRKDGAAHMAERRAIFPTVSPKTVKQVWTAQFRTQTARILDGLAPRGTCDLVADYAMPVSAEALKAITGLTNMTAFEMNRVRQGMIDGCANYAGDAQVEANCHDCTVSIDAHIDAMIPVLDAAPDHSLLSVQRQAGLSDAQVRANIKLAISGAQAAPAMSRGRPGRCCPIRASWTRSGRARRPGLKPSRNTRAGSRPSACRRAGWRSVMSATGSPSRPRTVCS